MKSKQLLVIVVVVLAVVAAWRMIGSGGGGAGAVSLEDRKAVRIFICEGCGFVEPADSTAIQQRYNDNQVGSAEGESGPPFGCSSCGEIKAPLVTVDFLTASFRCNSCGKAGPKNASELLQAAKNGEVRIPDSGEIQIKCPDCDDFTCVLATAAQPGSM